MVVAGVHVGVVGVGEVRGIRTGRAVEVDVSCVEADDAGDHVREDVDYCCMPLFHGNAIMALWAPALAVGATVCLTPNFSAFEVNSLKPSVGTPKNSVSSKAHKRA